VKVESLKSISAGQIVPIEEGKDIVRKQPYLLRRNHSESIYR
jgi:hypothetical protein